MKTLEKMKEQFGSIEFCGEQYILVEPAEFDCYLRGNELDEFYVAKAVKVNCESCEGALPIYKLEWDIKDSFKESNDEDASRACDWDNPRDVSLLTSHELYVVKK